MTTSEPKLPINVKLGATAEAKFSVSTQVPEASSGRLVDALTDLIRPFSESRGLRADRIRLQREEVLIEIARRTTKRLELEKRKISAVPNKLLVPLLEQASHEDLSDEFMLDQWSNLLASATKSGSVEPRYIAILSELSGKQARLLEKICKTTSDRFENWRQLLNDAPVFLKAHTIRAVLVAYFREKKSIPEIDAIIELIQEELDYPGSAIVDIIINFEDDSWSKAMTDDHPYGKNEYALDLEILTSLGLLRRANFFVYSRFKHEVQIIYYHVTELGVAMYGCCNSDS